MVGGAGSGKIFTHMPVFDVHEIIFIIFTKFSTNDYIF